MIAFGLVCLCILAGAAGGLAGVCYFLRRFEFTVDCVHNDDDPDDPDEDEIEEDLQAPAPPREGPEQRFVN